LPKDTQAPKELKVTDKRIFTPEGDIREEFKQEIKPAEPAMDAFAPPPPPPREEKPRAEKNDLPRTDESRERKEAGRTMADKATNPGSAFTNFIEPLIAQGYMSLGMLRNPYQPQAKIDAGAARQMIEILTLLKDKTKGNLTPDEDDFLDTHLGELKLAFVQRTKSI